MKIQGDPFEHRDRHMGSGEEMKDKMGQPHSEPERHHRHRKVGDKGFQRHLKSAQAAAQKPGEADNESRDQKHYESKEQGNDDRSLEIEQEPRTVQ